MTAGALNVLQTEAVKQGLQRRFSVVQGPPGTGGARFEATNPGCFTNCFCSVTFGLPVFFLNKYNIYDVFMRFSALPMLPGKTTFLVHLVTALTNLELDPTLRSVRTWKLKDS